MTFSSKTVHRCQNHPICQLYPQGACGRKTGRAFARPGAAGKNEFYHPRLRGSFPRVLGRYVRQHKVVALPEMIRKMTSLPAKVYDLEGKGYIREGFDADICIFDANTIIDKATYNDPTQRAEGLHWVIVGGAVAAENAVSTGSRKGKVMKRRLLPNVIKLVSLRTSDRVTGVAISNTKIIA